MFNVSLYAENYYTLVESRIKLTNIEFFRCVMCDYVLIVLCMNVTISIEILMFRLQNKHSIIRLAKVKRLPFSLLVNLGYKRHTYILHTFKKGTLVSFEYYEDIGRVYLCPIHIWIDITSWETFCRLNEYHYVRIYAQFK